jgi:glycosyltransferase involved in cell wall biosynthesis
MKKLSIITINYNNLGGLQTTLNSVAAQSWQEFEHIIIDGGSTDGSMAYIETQAHRFAYWVSEPDKGVYHAMNKGISKASGEYLIFLNSGDHFYDNRVLEKNNHLILDYDLIYFNMHMVGQNKIYIKDYPDSLSFAYFLKDNLPHQATFIKKNIFERVGLFKEDFKIVSDWKFFLDSICKHSASYYHIDKTLTTFYLNGVSSLIENKKVIDDEKQEVLRGDYSAYLKDLEEVLKNMNIIHTLRRSRIIKFLVKFGFLNKF